MFPRIRPRRLRQSKAMRSLVKETRLSPSSLIAPLFIAHGRRFRKPIPSMPGQFQLSIDEALKEIQAFTRAGIGAVILFGLPKKKNGKGTEAYASSGIIQQALKAIKKKFPGLIVMADLCFCEYTSHGHCGILKKKGRSFVLDNDATLKLIATTAVVQARAGADVVAPSGMIDGCVGVIRAALDKAGFKDTVILSYSAKYASAFYGPFRDAAESAPAFGNRKTYQMNPANAKEALREIQEDVREGADMVMVKPALSYLDIIARVKPNLTVPLVAYNVSGEYSLVKAGEKLGWFDKKTPSPLAMEILTSIKRAGADMIITYHALEAARELKSK